MNLFRWGGKSKPEEPETASPPGNPLELISYNTENGKFHLGKEALQVLRKVNGPVGVVAVSGRARQGKSFILNQLLGQSSGFTVASTHRPCTKGLWMWSTPVERRNPDGSTYHLVLLDTEGIDAYDQTGQYSTQIFSLAVLLSSLFVYNQMGGIDEAALDRLSLVTEMTRHIRVKAGAASGESELADFTPSFLWLLRDFYLTLEEEGRKITPREYLETALRHLNGTGAAVDAKNQIRESIKALFPNRDCFSLVRPHNDERQLAQLEALPPQQLRPEFREGLEKLTKLIFARAQPKRLGTQIISGCMLAALVEAYVDAINHGAVPTIATAWQGVAEAECRRAADVAEAKYSSSFNQGVEAEEAALDAEHLRCMAIAHQAYTDIAVGDESVRKAHEARFTERLSSTYATQRKERLASAEVQCRKEIQSFTTHLTQVAARQGVTREMLQQEMANFEARYQAGPAAGSVKWQLLAELRRLYDGIVNQVEERREREEAKTRASALAQAEARAQAAEQEAQARSGRRIQDLQAQLARAQRDLEGERIRAEAEQATHSSSSAALRKELNEASSGHQSVLAQLQSERDAARQDAESARAESRRYNDKLQVAEARVADLQAQLAAAQSAPRHAAPDFMATDGEAGEAFEVPDEVQDPQPKSMTIAQMKDYLVENGHEDKAYELASKKAKKGDYVAVMQSVLGT
ncbi:hypothetical protein WJX73_001407 [Symbiochloris irregularis]|uniref:GB1/RHD3-type G domain-containing protein n=1 Tax=Symbiochloris irregularis TaxID=706552 RepID=A0AAW1NX43_9CHLO